MAPATCVLALLSAAAPADSAATDAQAPQCWLKTPTVSAMTGFLYEPLKPYTIHQWMENLGSRFDADQWVKDFQEAGATHLVFYDKWIDGLVFHDTKTTGFKTHRDLVRELAAACHRRGLPLILYFNAISDGNPEFDRWAIRDKEGRPIVFSPRWPTRYQTLHSPFRQKAIEQVRELLSHYGPIPGIWHDIFHERLDTSSRWVAEGYQAMFGEPFAQASPDRLAEFNARTLADYLDEVDQIRREQGQTACLFTANGSGTRFLPGGIWTDLVGSRLHYVFNEGHDFARNDQLARMAWVLPKPLDINFKLNRSWFTPLEETPPPSHLTEKQAIAGTAIAVCQGTGVHWALTPGHAGTFGEDLQRAKAAGAWFRTVKPWLEGAEPYADVAVVLGTPGAGGPGMPRRNPFWTRYHGTRPSAWQSAVAVSDALQGQGVFSRLLYMSGQGGNWPPSLDPFRAVVLPETALVDQTHLEALREYVRGGGRLVAFGHASLLDGMARRRTDYGLADLFGAHLVGQIAFPPDSQPATVRVDSEYNEAFGAHVLTDGDGEAWASAGTPMPHWIEVTLPKPVEVDRVELVNRPGPYQITDVEIETRQQNQWQPIASVQGATGRVIRVPLRPPRQVDQLRIKIPKERYQGQDRQYADVRAVRVVDTRGRNWVGGSATPVPVEIRDPDLRAAFGDQAAAWPPMAGRVRPTTATVAATFQSRNTPAAILKNRFGQGDTYLFTTSDGVLPPDHPVWKGLARLAAATASIVLENWRVQASPREAERSACG